MSTRESTSDAEWYWSKRGSDERNGPVSRERLEELAEAGEIELDDLVWRKGFDDWKKASSVGEVEELFASPPPVPQENDLKNEEDEGEEPPTPSQNGSDSDDRKTAEAEGIGGYEFPIEFKVEWGGKLWSSSATLELREDEVALKEDEGDIGGGIDYSNIRSTGVDGDVTTIQGPLFFNKEETGKAEFISYKNHYITFESNESAEKARRLISKRIKSIELSKESIEAAKEEGNGYRKSDSRIADSEGKVTGANGGKAPFWKRHPVWTGIAFLFVLGTVSNAFDDSASDGVKASNNNGDEEVQRCKKKAGVYVGSYTAKTSSGPRRGDAGFILDDDCSYKVSMDGSEMGTGKASPKSNQSFELENGNTVYMSNETARMEESGGNYEVVYEMSRLPSEE